MLAKTKKRQSRRSWLFIGFFLCTTLATTSAFALQIVQQSIEEPVMLKEESDMTAEKDTSAPQSEGTTARDASSDIPAETSPQQHTIVANTSVSRKDTNVASPVQSAAREASRKVAVSPQPAYTMQVNEQFDGSTLDTSLWEVITYPKGYRNNEEQDYRPSQVKIADGALQLTAQRDENGEWHSGEVHSKWAYTYGEFEVRLALSTTGPGVWPAAWLMGSTNHWPDGGEIDIFENINGSNTVHGTIHGGGPNGHWQLQKSFSSIDVKQYHTYKIVKQPGTISWWVDGVKRGEWLKSETPEGSVWPFEDHRNIGLLNLAIGGNWPGPSTDATPDTIVMSIDYFTVKNAS